MVKKKIVFSYAPVAATCNERKRNYMNKLEVKIEAGTERLINNGAFNGHRVIIIYRSVSSMVNTLSQILSNQKKTDYKPEEHGVPEISAVSTCIYGNTL